MQIRSRVKPGSRSSRSVVIVVTPDSQRHFEAADTLRFRKRRMRPFLVEIYTLVFLLTEMDAAGVGKAWQVLPYATDYWNHPSWPRFDTSAFEIRSVSGVGRLDPLENPRKNVKPDKTESSEPNSLPDDRYENRDEANDDSGVEDEIPRTGTIMRVLQSEDGRDLLEEDADDKKRIVSRVRRDAENETQMEQISTTKNVREVRVNSPESWMAQPLSIEFPQRNNLDQMIQQTMDDDDMATVRSYHAPRANFITSHHRRSYDHREARDMPVTRGYDDYESPWYRNALRERDYDPPSYRRGYNYYYPDRYRMERDYYMRMPQDYSYYYDRYRDEDLDLYGRGRPTPKPKRIIYYATLPEIVRKPVDLRNYPRTYDATRTPVSRDGTYKRVPGNVDPSRYRYRNLYDGYDSYSKRSNFADRPYSYPEDESRRKTTLDNLRNNDPFDQNSDRKASSQSLARNDAKVPWPVQIGTEVSVKDDERISGRKVFGENGGYERFQSAQLQKAPDATGSSELQSDN